MANPESSTPSGGTPSASDLAAAVDTVLTGSAGWSRTELSDTGGTRLFTRWCRHDIEVFLVYTAADRGHISLDVDGGTWTSGTADLAAVTAILPRLLGADGLAAVTANLQDHIEARAAEIAAPRVAAVQADAATQVRALEDKLAASRQRWEDLEAELRRQLRHVLFRADRLAEKHGERRDQHVAAERAEYEARLRAARP